MFSKVNKTGRSAGRIAQKKQHRSKLRLQGKRVDEKALREKYSDPPIPEAIKDALKGLREANSFVSKAERALKKSSYALISHLFYVLEVAEDCDGLDALLAKYRDKDIRSKRTTHPAVTIARGEINASYDHAYRWGAVIQLAQAAGETSKTIVGFIKDKGGIEKCVDLYRAAKRMASNPRADTRDSGNDDAEISDERGGDHSNVVTLLPATRRSENSSKVSAADSGGPKTAVWKTEPGPLCDVSLIVLPACKADLARLLGNQTTCIVQVRVAFYRSGLAILTEADLPAD